GEAGGECPSGTYTRSYVLVSSTCDSAIIPAPKELAVSGCKSGSEKYSASHNGCTISESVTYDFSESGLSGKSSAVIDCTALGDTKTCDAEYNLVFVKKQ